MSPHAKSSNPEAQDEVKLLEKKSSDSSISSYSGSARRGTEISIYICADGHKFNCEDIPKSSYDTSHLKSITSFQNPPRSKFATCCFIMALLVIVTMTTIALTAGVYLRSQETLVGHDHNVTVTNLTNILKQGTNSSQSESLQFEVQDDFILSTSSLQ
ncbi:hypothetical protein KP79_PYT18406 [Mizuhopecten yessoensis]|uniref:Uncharacterized protein n=1 Tax=Mizuhopecten yessoensis TaxID=6573 RepID=A0A210PG39_MIZYE|nr:hypothetical protein KP79_PYT18406 [Mizuhopecten yessoensis]